MAEQVVVCGDPVKLAAAYEPSAPTVVVARPRLRLKAERYAAAEVFSLLDGKVCRAVVCVSYSDPRCLAVVPPQWRYRSMVHFKHVMVYVFEPRTKIVAQCRGDEGLFGVDLFGLDRVRVLMRAFVGPDQHVLDPFCSDELVLRAAREHGHPAVGWDPSEETAFDTRRALRQIELFPGRPQAHLAL